MEAALGFLGGVIISAIFAYALIIFCIYHFTKEA